MTNIVSLINMSWYKSVFKIRPGGRSGGVALFIQDVFTYSEGDDLNVYNTFNFESLFVEVSGIDNNKHMIGVIYRPPDNNIDSFVV